MLLVVWCIYCSLLVFTRIQKYQLKGHTGAVFCCKIMDDNFLASSGEVCWVAGSFSFYRIILLSFFISHSAPLLSILLSSFRFLHFSSISFPVFLPIYPFLAHCHLSLLTWARTDIYTYGIMLKGSMCQHIMLILSLYFLLLMTTLPEGLLLCYELLCSWQVGVDINHFFSFVTGAFDAEVRVCLTPHRTTTMLQSDTYN